MSYMTREDWAKDRTTVYADMDNPRPASKRLSDYATAEEIEAAIAAIKRVYSEYGRQMRLGECDYSYRRREINLALKDIKRDAVPWFYVRLIKPPPPELALILDRYNAAKQAADEAWAREVAATPIDDAAWEEELERRREIDRYFGR